jgi:phage-related baseplate assembly protein
MSTTIDMSKIPPPAIVEALDFEVIFQSLLTNFQTLCPDWQAQVESDPVMKLLELAAYREMLLRARINDTAHACMLAYASGTDLDNLAALLNVKRLYLADGTPEPDTRLRKRAQMSLEGLTVAGSKGSYEFHVLSSSLLVKDVAVDSPMPGKVRVTVLSTTDGGNADAALLQIVNDYLSADTLRPLTDEVLVQAVQMVDFRVEASLHLFPGPSSATVITAARQALDNYLSESSKIGYDITLSGIYAALHQPGVRLVTLLSPAADLLISELQCARCTSITITEGTRDV